MCVFIIVQQMGYSPFRPHMSFSSGGSAQPLPAVPEQKGGGGGAEGAEGAGEGEEEVEVEVEEIWVAEVDDAFAMLLSLGKEFLPVC